MNCFKIGSGINLNLMEDPASTTMGMKSNKAANKMSSVEEPSNEISKNNVNNKQDSDSESDNYFNDFNIKRFSSKSDH